MIDEELQDQASLYLLRMLPPEEEMAFEKRMAHDDELRALIEQMESAAAHLALSAPPVLPPAELKARILSDVRHEVRVVPITMGRRFAWVPWALAAGLAIAATIFWQESRFLRDQNRVQEMTLADLRSRDALSTVQIAALNAKVANYEKALAIVIFDAEHQRGLVKLDRFPKVPSGKDYQLWVIPTGGKPVSAGVVPVGGEGLARVSFTPTQEVQAIDAFAISVEPSGGSEQPRGEIVFVGK